MVGDEESHGGINVGYKPLITSWETPQCPPLPSFLSDTLNCSNIVSWETKYDRDKVPQKSGSREQTLLFRSLLNRRGETSDWLVIITSDWVVMDPGLATHSRSSKLFKVASLGQCLDSIDPVSSASNTTYLPYHPPITCIIRHSDRHFLWCREGIL